MSRLREEHQTPMSRLREEHQTPMSRLREEHQTPSCGDCPRSGSPTGSWDTGGVSSQPGPAPREQKPRLLQDGRDMFWSLAPLVLACIVLAGLVGMCSFQATGPKTGPAPSYDAPDALRADAAQLGFPVRLPQLPEGWHANSGRRGAVDAARTSTVGYLTPGGMYVSLTQSNADEQKLIASFGSDLYPTGAQNVDGISWVIYQGGENSRPVWTTRLGGPTGPAQIAITGGGSPDEFRTLAAATQSQPPLPAR
jgi:hypothetical protein